jgi:hypothetical protein
MSKFLIFKKLENGYGEKMGSYEADAKDDSSKNRSYLMSEPMASHFELPEGMDEDCVSLVFVPEVLSKDASDEIWTNGEKSVFSANDIPVLFDEDGSPRLDPSFKRIEGRKEGPAHYKLVENERLVRIKKQRVANEKLEQIRQLREPLLKEVDVKINKAEDKGLSSLILREYREALRNCTEDLKQENGQAKPECEHIDVNEFKFPSKP